MAGDEIQTLLKTGIQAAKNGNKDVARGIFEQVLALDSQNEVAWLWMASVVSSPAEREKALRRVLQINPNNDRAQRALAKIQQAQPPAEDAAPPSPSPSSAPPADAPPTATPPTPKTPPRQERSSGLSGPIFYGGILLGVLLIGLAVALLLLDSGDEPDDTAQPLVASPVAFGSPIAATSMPSPTATRIFVTVPPGRAGSRADLPPTWTSEPTLTDTPAPEPTTPAPEPDTFTLAFVAADNPGALGQLRTMRGDGEDVAPLAVNLDPARLQLDPRPSMTPVAEEVSPEAALATPDPALNEAESTADATAEATPEPVPELYEGLEFFDPAYSPDGSLLVFSAQIAPELQELFLLDVSSGVTRQLTTLGASFTREPRFSPDGQQIAFSSNQAGPGVSGQFDILLFDLTSEEVSNITTSNAQERHPTWSPDGARLVFASDQGTPGELEVWSMDLLTREMTQLTNAANSSFAPAFSHEGQQIAFISNRGGDNDLYIMRADGTSEQLITINDSVWEEHSPAWSPDDAWLALASNRDNQRALQVWLVRPNGTDWRPLTEGLGPSTAPAWRPNSTE